MNRGPVSHAGIASRALRNSYHRESGISFYDDKLGNGPGTVELMLARIYQDYMTTAPAMRSCAGEEKMQQLQKVCRMFQLFLDNLATKLSEEASSHLVNELCAGDAPHKKKTLHPHTTLSLSPTP